MTDKEKIKALRSALFRCAKMRTYGMGSDFICFCGAGSFVPTALMRNDEKPPPDARCAEWCREVATIYKETA